MKAAAWFMVVLVVVSLIPGSAWAGSEVFYSFRAMVEEEALKEGKQIVITFEASERGAPAEVKGKVVNLTDRAITVRLEELPWTTDLAFTRDGSSYEIEIPEGRVRHIREGGDSLKNGALIGAAVGGVGMGALAAGMCSDGGDCTGVAPAALFYAGIGALVGVGIDALIKNEDTVYIAPSLAGGRDLKFSAGPSISKDSKGAVFTIIW